MRIEVHAIRFAVLALDLYVYFAAVQLSTSVL